MTEKKERKFLLAALLVVTVLITSILVGTLAKYITTGEISDEGNAAKFGLNIPNTVNLFSDSYTNVQAETDGKKIIAPGTSGQYKFEVTGTSEVSYKVSAEIAVNYSEAWDGYEPLEFSIDGTNWTNLTDFKTNLSSALSSETMSPNAAYASTQTIYWRWPFFVSEENDVKDTNIGSLAADGTVFKVTVSITVTASQVD